MSGISSGVGLISGINFTELIDSLIAIDRRPIDNLQNRVERLDFQRSAILELSAQILAIKNAALGFSRPSFFSKFSSISSDEKVLKATASDKALPGTFSFRVLSLVTNFALISRAFPDRNSSPVGAGTITIDSVKSKINRETPLGELNGGAGIRLGEINITDGEGSSSKIDLSTALTVQDVLKAINQDDTVKVRAFVTGISSNGATGDRIVIEDLSGGNGSLSITEVSGGKTASDLGLIANTTTGRIDGRDLIRLTNSTPLSLLNDGNGIGHFRAGTDLILETQEGMINVSLTENLATRLDTDLRALNSGQGVRLGVIRITNKSGDTHEIDLSGAKTVRDLLDTINNAGAEVSASLTNVNDESLFLITDESTPRIVPEGEDVPLLKIEDVSGYTAADLGIDREADSISGRDIYHMKTIGDVINAIHFAPGNEGLVEAYISEDGNAIILKSLGAGNTVSVKAGVDSNGLVSTAAADLGIADAQNTTRFRSRNLLAGLNTVLLSSLKGGVGINLGTIRVTDGSGASASIDLTSANTLQDIMDLINQDESISITASVNSAGNGLSLQDDSGGIGKIDITDETGSTAQELGIEGQHILATGESINGGNLQLQYVTRQTLVEDLNGGRGLSLGAFQITDSSGAVHIVDLESTVITNLGDVIDTINRQSSDTIQAKINSTGDGIVIIDTSTGTLPLKIEDRDGGQAAESLQIAGEARGGEQFINGSNEIRIEISASDTLDELARKINNSGAFVSASVIQSGDGLNPFSLTLTSELTGRRGELVIDTEGLNLGLATLSKAKDAVVSIGAGDDIASRLVTSSTNSLENVIPGVTLDLLSISDDPVTITIAQDIDTIVGSLQRFADVFNGAMDTIDQATKFDSETFERGPLFGDSTVDLVRNRLVRLTTRSFEDVSPSLSRLFSIGLRLASGNRLQFDEERFREVYQESPELVERLFTQDETGIAAVMDEVLDELTRDFDGVLTTKNEQLIDQQELINDRIDSLGVLLEAKRSRLQAQFLAMELALAGLQAQQSSLSTLASLTGR